MSESKMGKILKSILEKAKADVEEEKKKEEEMSEKNKTTDLPIDDIIGELDTALNDILGDTTTCKSKLSSEELLPIELRKEDKKQPVKKEISRQSREKVTPAKAGLDQYCDKTWICYMEDGQLVPVDLEDATAEQFGNWLAWIYPPAKSYLKEDLHYYSKFENRQNAFKNTVGFLSRLPSLFKAYGDTGFIQKSDKAKRNKEKKDE